jgi:hypothetical protein
MFVRLTRGHYDVAKEAEIQRIVEEHLIPGLKQLPGFQSYTGGVDRHAGRVLATSVWDTAAQSEAVNALRVPFGSLIQFEPTEVYEVTAHA